MIISDLNYLENTSEEIFGGRGILITGLYTQANVVANTSTLRDSVTPFVVPVVANNTATATATADAREANNTYTNTSTSAQTEAFSSESVSISTAVSV